MHDQCGTSDLIPASDLNRRSREGRRSQAPMTRRRAVLLGAAAGVGALAGLGGDEARAVLRFDLNQGNVQPLPIALPDFLAGSPSDGLPARKSGSAKIGRAHV